METQLLVLICFVVVPFCNSTCVNSYELEPGICCTALAINTNANVAIFPPKISKELKRCPLKARNIDTLYFFATCPIIDWNKFTQLFGKQQKPWYIIFTIDCPPNYCIDAPPLKKFSCILPNSKTCAICQKSILESRERGVSEWISLTTSTEYVPSTFTSRAIFKSTQVITNYSFSTKKPFSPLKTRTMSPRKFRPPPPLPPKPSLPFHILKYLEENSVTKEIPVISTVLPRLFTPILTTNSLPNTTTSFTQSSSHGVIFHISTTLKIETKTLAKPRRPAYPRPLDIANFSISTTTPNSVTSFWSKNFTDFTISPIFLSANITTESTLPILFDNYSAILLNSTDFLLSNSTPFISTDFIDSQISTQNTTNVSRPEQLAMDRPKILSTTIGIPILLIWLGTGIFFALHLALLIKFKRMRRYTVETNTQRPVEPTPVPTENSANIPESIPLLNRQVANNPLPTIPEESETVSPNIPDVNIPIAENDFYDVHL